MAKKLSPAAQKRIALATSRNKPLNRGQTELAKCFNPDIDRYKDTFKVHANGVVERTARATVEQAEYFLRGRRAFDKYECWENLNRDWLNAFVNQGLVEAVDMGAGQTMYFVTQKAADRFSLRPVTSEGMPFRFA